MKQKDLALIMIVVIVSGMLSFFISQKIFSSGQKRQLQAEQVDPISTTFDRPSSKYFNAQSINPTQTIQIGDGVNNTPFASQ